MKKMMLTAMLGLLQMSVFAETNALIEVKLFKTWVIPGEHNFCSMSIKNTGTTPIRLAKRAGGQIAPRLLSDKSNAEFNSAREEIYQTIADFFELPPEETHMYDGLKIGLPVLSPEDNFFLSVYLGKGFWLDSESVSLTMVTPDSEEHLVAITDWQSTNFVHNLFTVTYKGERWLYKWSSLSQRARCWPICPLSLTNKIRVEPHDGKGLFKIWDGDGSMTYGIREGRLLEGPDENDVFGKWTRERKQQAEADNAEVRRKKAEVP